MLSGVHEHVLQQIEMTEATEAIHSEDIFLAEAGLTASTRQAWTTAQEWIAGEGKETRDE